MLPMSITDNLGIASLPPLSTAARSTLRTSFNEELFLTILYDLHTVNSVP